MYCDIHTRVTLTSRLARILSAIHRKVRVKWDPCHHGMGRPQVADEGDGLQIWKVAENILNKLSRTADRGWSSSLGVGRLTTPHRKKIQSLTKYTLEPRTRTDSLAKRPWHRKMDMRFVT
jgi:hypothetical protein